jgi:23S rRNA pseudouridine2457 synthase
MDSYLSSVLIAFHKPYGIISQFTPDGSGLRTLAEFGFPPGVYPIGRLDADSEGLLLLSDEPELNQRLLHPRRAHPRIYWAQVEHIPTAAALARLAKGVVVQGRKTLPCRAWILDPQPKVPPRDPPIRFRKSVPDCWIGLELVEGRNRQVRRMTAVIGHPTLRLVRVQIGRFQLGSLAPGRWRTCKERDRRLVLGEPPLWVGRAYPRAGARGECFRAAAARKNGAGTARPHGLGGEQNFHAYA